MDITLKDRFASLWDRYFPGADLPLTFEIGGPPGGIERAPVPTHHRCVVCDLARVRKGTSRIFDAETIGCPGGRFYLGYEHERSPDFCSFLSYGKPGVVEGERYKRTPELVEELDRQTARLPTGDRPIVFKRWDSLDGADNPDAVVFFARPDVLSGLFTLANYDRGDPYGVIAPFGAGCGSIVHFPWLEQQREDPRAVFGMFDPSARPCVLPDTLTIAFPMTLFERVIGFMEESFLVTDTWTKVKKRMDRSTRS